MCATNVWDKREDAWHQSESETPVRYSGTLAGRTHFKLLSKNVHTYWYSEDDMCVRQQSHCQAHKVALCVSDVCSSEKMHWQKYASNWCVISLVFRHHQRKRSTQTRRLKNSTKKKKKKILLWILTGNKLVFVKQLCHSGLRAFQARERKEYNLIYRLLQ